MNLVTNHLIVVSLIIIIGAKNSTKLLNCKGIAGVTKLVNYVTTLWITLPYFIFNNKEPIIQQKSYITAQFQSFIFTVFTIYPVLKTVVLFAWKIWAKLHEVVSVIILPTIL